MRSLFGSVGAGGGSGGRGGELGREESHLPARLPAFFLPFLLSFFPAFRSLLSATGDYIFDPTEKPFGMWKAGKKGEAKEGRREGREGVREERNTSFWHCDFCVRSIYRSTT